MFQFLQSRRRQNKRNTHRTKRRRLCSEPLEARRLLAASLGWDGPGQGSAELTYYIANSPASLSQAETDAAIETALAAWSSAADITFTETDQPQLRDSIDISFTNIDGVGGTLAQAYFPDDVNPARIAGDVQFDSSDAWEVGNSLGRQAFDLVYVAVHEIGHSLGLDHLTDFGSVLAPFVSANQSFSTLEASDALEIQALYAAADGVATDSPVNETPEIEAPVDDSATDETTNDETDSDNDAEPDSDSDPFPRRRWRRGGNWRGWGGRLSAETPQYNYTNPTDVNGDGNTSPLDALMVINQLSLGTSSEGVEIAGLCDTNGDGAITPLDALTVINALSSGAENSSATASPEETTSIDETTTIDESESPTGEVDDSTDSIDTVDNVDDTADETVENTVDGNDGTDDSETTETETETDEQEIDEQEIDDGGMLDDSDEPEVDDHHHTDHHHTDHFNSGHFNSGHVNVGLLGKDAETLITRFDTNDDSSLSQGEVSERLWAKLTELEVDENADGLVTLAELETAITAARQEAFNEKDADGDGLLFETEVSERFWSKISTADTDSDGGVSFDELEAFKAQQQADQNDVEPTDVEQPSRRIRHQHRSSDAVFASIGRAVHRR